MDWSLFLIEMQSVSSPRFALAKPYSTVRIFWIVNKFKIINQYSVASGVRRLEAVSNIGVDNFETIQTAKNKETSFRTQKEIHKYLNLIRKIQPEKKIGINNNMELEEQLKDIKKTYNDIQFDTNISKNKKQMHPEGRITLTSTL